MSGKPGFPSFYGYILNSLFDLKNAQSCKNRSTTVRSMTACVCLATRKSGSSAFYIILAQPYIYSTPQLFFIFQPLCKNVTIAECLKYLDTF